MYNKFILLQVKYILQVIYGYYVYVEQLRVL